MKTEIMCGGIYKEIQLILQSGNELHINAMKANIKAHVYCIEGERQREKTLFDLEGRIDKLYALKRNGKNQWRGGDRMKAKRTDVEIFEAQLKQALSGKKASNEEPKDIKTKPLTTSSYKIEKLKHLTIITIVVKRF